MGKVDIGFKSLTECVMDYFKKQLNIGALIPGDEVNINLLSETLGISRTPIREALIQLVKDGFVELVSRRKFVIKKLTLEDIKQIYHLIGLLEAEAAKIACDKITDAEIKELEDIYERMEEALNNNDAQTYLDLNFRSHAFISRFCENQILLEIIAKQKERLYEFPKIVMIIPEWDKKLMADHVKMIQYLKTKDKQGLEDVIKNEHWDFNTNYPFIFRYYEIFSLKQTS
jgi:DNA-binding GntR family transcriptional regulator